jgi:uncharacterized membrane protein
MKTGMIFLPVSAALFFILLLLIPILLMLVPAVAFVKMGLNPAAGLLFYMCCIFGSLFNIPVYRRRLHSLEGEEVAELFRRFFGINLPVLRERVIALNVGGAVLPVLFSIYLFSIASFYAAVIGVAITSAVSFLVSRPVKGVGIVIPAFIPAFAAVISALVFAGDNPSPVAYISGVLGILIGADLLRLAKMRELDVAFLSIGGAGIFDGIFLVGILSAFIS